MRPTRAFLSSELSSPCSGSTIACLRTSQRELLPKRNDMLCDRSMSSITVGGTEV
jgi:hypothetical protein